MEEHFLQRTTKNDNTGALKGSKGKLDAQADESHLS